MPRTSAIDVSGFLAIVIVSVAIVQRGGSQPQKVELWYHANGRIEQERPLDPDGKPHGLLKGWREDGTLRMEAECVHGEAVAVRRFDQTGELTSEEREGSNYRLKPIFVP